MKNTMGGAKQALNKSKIADSRNFNKLVPCGTDGRLFTTDVLTSLPSSKSRDTKTRIQNPARSKLDIVP